MFAVSKSGQKIQLLTPEEDELVTAAALSDPDNLPFTDAELEQALPHLTMPGRGIAALTKERISIRLTRSVVDQFRATGDGWQARIDQALQDWLKDHSPA